MQDKWTHETLLASLLLAISIISVTPPLTHAAQNFPANPITIDATGQATAFGNGPSGPTTMTLNATVYTNSNHWLIIQNMTGTLTIGTSTFAIINGQGSVNTFGDVAIFCNTNASSSQNELILHGSMNGNNLTFDSPSQIVSLAYLSLSGTLNQNNTQTESQLTGSTNSTATITSFYNTTSTDSTATNSTSQLSATTLVQENSTQSGIRNVTTTSVNSTVASALVQQNSTQTSVATTLAANATIAYTLLTQNSTQSNAVNATTALGNLTETSAVATANTTTAGSLIGNVSAPNNPSAAGNSTVTVTQYLNQTISATQTIASVTISYTTTVTVANRTITQANRRPLLRKWGHRVPPLRFFLMPF